MVDTANAASKAAQDGAPRELPARAAFFDTIDPDEQAFLDEASIGDLLRGARLTRGDFDIERVAEELNIKKRVIDGIEMVDPSRLPKDVFLKNAMRAYVQYLKPQFPYPTEYALEKFFEELRVARERIAAEEAAARAEAEAQRAAADAEAADGAPTDWKPFELPTENLAPKPATAVIKPPAKKRHVIDDFAPPPPPPTPAYQPPREPLWTQIAPVATLGAAVAVVGGLAWGVWSLLEDVQRIGLEQRAAAPAELRIVERRDTAARSADVVRPAADAYAAGGVLTQVYDAPEAQSLDRPIAELSPSEVGAFRGLGADGEPLDPAEARAGLDAAAAAAALERVVAPTRGAPETADAGVVLPPPSVAPQTAAADPAVPAWRGPKLALHADGAIWVRVVDVLGDTVFIGNIADGEFVALPYDRGALVLRTGNAGGTVLVLDGVAYGPMGERGFVKTVEIVPSRITRDYEELPEVTAALRAAPTEEPVRTAEPATEAPENVQ